MDEVLVVCTANICRSPMAEALLRTWLAHHAPDVADSVRVSSAGVRARDGDPAAPHMVAIADRWGLDLHDHRSRPATVDLATGATLVVTMEAAHRDAVARLATGLAARTFTLPELAELAAHAPTPDPDDGSGLTGLAQRLHRARPRVWVDAPDVDDPYGGAASGYELTAGELVALTERVGPALAAALRDHRTPGTTVPPDS